MRTVDYLIIGGGIVGVCIARQLKRRYPDATVQIVDKEPFLGQHASGRNSGVIHAGFYYHKDSLKARFARQGNIALTQYCRQRNLPLRRCGKLVVATSEAQHQAMDLLLQRALANRVPLLSVSEEDAAEIEPRARTVGRALWSPSTSTTDPVAVLSSLASDAQDAGVAIQRGCEYLSQKGDIVETTSQRYRVGYTINAAGLYADRIARDYGFAQDLCILPFKGLYLHSNEPAASFRTNIYPVPDLRNPFLGVHFTVTVDGHVKIGPTAIPALWREQYRAWEGFRIDELWQIIRRQASLLVYADFDFRRLAFEEVQKFNRRHLVNLAAGLAHHVRPEHFAHWGKPGIRAQLVNTRTKRLEMDFLVQGDARSFHVLNAVSPGFTTAMPFAEYCCDQIDELYN